MDGFISIAAALCAVRLCPAVRDVLFLSHDSYEVGYRIAAETLGLQPCLRLGMRLGEGSGCPLLFRVLEGACGVMRGMATFGEASIEDSYLDEIRRWTPLRWRAHETSVYRRLQKRQEQHGPTHGAGAGRGGPMYYWATMEPHDGEDLAASGGTSPTATAGALPPSSGRVT